MMQDENTFDKEYIEALWLIGGWTNLLLHVSLLLNVPNQVVICRGH